MVLPACSRGKCDPGSKATAMLEIKRSAAEAAGDELLTWVRLRGYSIHRQSSAQQVGTGMLVQIALEGSSRSGGEGADDAARAVSHLCALKKGCETGDHHGDAKLLSGTPGASHDLRWSTTATSGPSSLHGVKPWSAERDARASPVSLLKREAQRRSVYVRDGNAPARQKFDAMDSRTREVPNCSCTPPKQRPAAGRSQPGSAESTESWHV